MPAALDTVLARASAEVRERFEHLLSADPHGITAPVPDALVIPNATGTVDTGESDRGELDQDGDMQRRQFLTDAAAGGITVALALGDAGTAITFARQVQLGKITLAERKASLFVEVAQAYTQWGRHENGLSALRTAYGIAPEEIRSRPAAHRIVTDLVALSRGHIRNQVLEFAASAGIRR